MNRDPIVDEVRAVRSAIAEEAAKKGITVFEHYRQYAKHSRGKYVELAPRQLRRRKTA